MTTGTALSREMTRAAEKASGRRYCGSHHAHLLLSKFEKHGHHMKCDACIEKTRKHEEFHHARRKAKQTG